MYVDLAPDGAAQAHLAIVGVRDHVIDRRRDEEAGAIDRFPPAITVPRARASSSKALTLSYCVLFWIGPIVVPCFDPSSTTAALASLAISSQKSSYIARLINLYATLNDAARWADVAALYAEDGSMVRPTAPDAPIVGRAAILMAFESRPPRTTRHICANIVVDVIDAETATATSAMLLFTAADAAPLVGGFVDRFRFVEGAGWRFTERRWVLTFA